MEMGEIRDPAGESDLAGLCGLLLECVRGGASIGFVEPVCDAQARAYWLRVPGEAARGDRLVLAARDAPGGPIVGSAQLAFEPRANGRHRGEVQTVLVPPAERRRGIASMLMSSVEGAAAARGVTLLFLDTSEGRGGAREFYDALGYSYVGGIPGYALDPDGTPARNAIYCKALA